MNSHDPGPATTRDPWVPTTVVLLGAAGTGTAAVAGSSFGVALLIGSGIGALVLTVHAVIIRLTAHRRRGGPPAGNHAQDASEFPPDTRSWLTRAEAAAQQLASYRARSTDPTLNQGLDDAASYVRDAADKLRQRARAVGVIDTTSRGEDSSALRQTQQRLKKEAAALSSGPLKRAKESAADAAAERAEARERLEELRDVLTATLESTTLRLEAAAERGSILVSMQAASEATDARIDLTYLNNELEAVQEGLDKLEDITRLLSAE